MKLILASEEELIYQRKRWNEILKQTKKENNHNQDIQTDCLIWLGYINKGGYGTCNYKSKQMRCHRISWIINNKVSHIPKQDNKNNKLEIRHMCNIKSCIEPTHLKIGTPLENGKDKIHSQRSAKGETHPQSTISKELAKKIKWSKTNRTDPLFKTRKQRAEYFGVSIYVIEGIDRNRTWSHIPDKNGTIDRTAINKVLTANRKCRKKTIIRNGMINNGMRPEQSCVTTNILNVT